MTDPDTVLVHDPDTRRVREGTKAGRTISILRNGRGEATLTLAGTGKASAKNLTLRDLAGEPLTRHEAGVGPADLAAVHLHGPTGFTGFWTKAEMYPVGKHPVRRSTDFLYKAKDKIEAWFSYCAYGALDGAASSANPLTRFRYTGQEWIEELGLYDYKARLYNPAIGRFLSPDPADQTPSPFMYVAGDPVNAVDPDGRVIVRALFCINKGQKRLVLLDESMFPVVHISNVQPTKWFDSVRSLYRSGRQAIRSTAK